MQFLYFIVGVLLNHMHLFLLGRSYWNCLGNPIHHRGQHWIHHLHNIWFQNNPGQVNIPACISYSVNWKAHTTPVRIYGEPYTHKFCAVDLFWNITHHQAISPDAKFHHVLGPGFMIQWVKLIFVKCLSANQNRLFYMKV